MTGVCDWECAETGGGVDIGDPEDDLEDDPDDVGPEGPECRRDFPRCCENIQRAACPDLLSRALNAVALISSPGWDWRNSSGFPGETFGSEIEVFD